MISADYYLYVCLKDIGIIDSKRYRFLNKMKFRIYSFFCARMDKMLPYFNTVSAHI